MRKSQLCSGAAKEMKEPSFLTRFCVTSPLWLTVPSAWGHRRQSFPLDPWHVSHQCPADGRRQQWLDERVTTEDAAAAGGKGAGPRQSVWWGQLPEAWSRLGSLAITLARMQFALLPTRWGCYDPMAPGASGGGQPLPPKHIQAARLPPRLSWPVLAVAVGGTSGLGPHCPPGSPALTHGLQGALLCPQLLGSVGGPGDSTREEGCSSSEGRAAEGTGAALGQPPPELSGYPGQEST